MKKIVLVLLICGVGILLFGGFFPLKSAQKEAGSETKQTSCAQVGNRISAQGTPDKCCEGLEAMGGYPGGYVGECSLPPPGGVFICSACGNTICDVDNLENKCNCPKDCK